jgi:DNA-binding GntR family transcriptional regulator
MITRPGIQPLAPLRATTVAEQVFDVLHEHILTCALPPGARLSEAEIARQMGVSRQPVREAFFRLSQLGFLLIRPQRATIVRPISAQEVLQAMYIRRALEAEVVSEAAGSLDRDNLYCLAELLDKQEQTARTKNKIQFHQLDNAFHKCICDAAGTSFVWALIKEKKVQMDRVRYLSLSFGIEQALSDHRAVFDALKTRDNANAEAKMRRHLTRIKDDLPRIRWKHEPYFSQEDT